MKKSWNSILFDNIGTKIQTVAKINFWIQIIVWTIAAIVVLVCGLIFFEDLWFFIFLAPLLVAVGGVVAWLSVMILFGFGKLVEDTSAIRNEVAPKKQISMPAVKAPTAKAPRKATEPIFVPPVANYTAKQNSHYVTASCPGCGKPLTVSNEEYGAVCPWCNTSFERKTPVVKKQAPTQHKPIAAMEKPKGFEVNRDWEKAIKAMGTNDIIKRYNNADEWSEDYRYLCYLELKARNVK